MSVTRGCERLEPLHSLRTKVEKIALGCMGLYVIGVAGEIVIILTPDYKKQENALEMFQHRALWSIIIETIIGIITSALLFCGARRKERYMLVPFMIVMVIIQAFLMITFFIFATLCLTGECMSEDQIIYFYLVLLFILISFTCWMFRTTKLLFDELRKEDIIGYPEYESSHPIHQVQISDVSQGILPELEPQNQYLRPRIIPLPNAHGTRINDAGYNSNLHVNLPNLNSDNSNVDTINTGAREEPPPDYNVATAMTNANTLSTNQPPPTYEDVMKNKKS